MKGLTLGRISKRLGLLLLIVVALAPFVIQVGDFWCYTNDDAFITYRYGRQLASGHGPYFNPGEHVEGYTNPLQMLSVAAIVRWFGADAAHVMTKCLGVLYGAGTVVLTFFTALTLLTFSRLGLARAWVQAGALLAAIMVSLSPDFAVNCTSGLETSQFALLMLLAGYLGVRELMDGKARGSAIVFALLVLARPEGVLVFAGYWLVCAVAEARVLLRGTAASANVSFVKRCMQSQEVGRLVASGVVVSLVFALQMGMRFHLYDGELLPNTFYAKRGGFFRGSTWGYLYGGLLNPLFGYGGLIVGVGGCLMGLRRLPRALLVIVSVVVAGGGITAMTGIDWMVGHRLAVPYLPAVAILLVLGWIVLAARVFPAKGTQVAAVLCAAILIPTGWWLQGDAREKVNEEILVRARGYVTGHAALAEWVGGRAAPGDTIAVMDIGIIGYICFDQRILDVSGLTDRFIAKAEGGFLGKLYDPAYVLDQEPEFIVLVFHGEGESYTRPSRGTVFYPMNEMEARLAEHPQFERWYRNKRSPAPVTSGDWLNVFAAHLGAERIFEHGHPGLHYLLAVYERKGEG